MYRIPSDIFLGGITNHARFQSRILSPGVLYLHLTFSHWLWPVLSHKICLAVLLSKLWSSVTTVVVLVYYFTVEWRLNDPQGFALYRFYNGKFIHYKLHGGEREDQQLTVSNLGLSWFNPCTVVGSEFVRIKLAVVTRFIGRRMTQTAGSK